MVSGKISQTMDAGVASTDNDRASRNLSTDRDQAPDSMMAAVWDGDRSLNLGNPAKGITVH